jgi:hypothetical protein
VGAVTSPGGAALRLPRPRRQVNHDAFIHGSAGGEDGIEPVAQSSVGFRVEVAVAV